MLQMSIIEYAPKTAENERKLEQLAAEREREAEREIKRAREAAEQEQKGLQPINAGHHTRETQIPESVEPACIRLKYWFKRCLGIVDILMVFIFGIILYIVDVGSDIMAGVNHLQKGNPVWGSLTITFIALPALCRAAVTWTEWHYDPKVRERDQKESKGIKDHVPIEERKRNRITRMTLAVLLLDPLVA